MFLLILFSIKDELDPLRPRVMWDVLFKALLMVEMCHKHIYDIY